ncbi:MAG TPA: DMT family transporter [Acidimicrobiia bacterium]|nr:DMT family transporter [Acidimicrobiia bacterium]
MLSRTTRAGLAIAAASFLFGSTFVVIKDAVASFPPISFVTWRFLLGGLVLMVFVPPRGKAVWRDGAVAGSLLFVGYSLQTAGLVTTGASNSALITGLFIIITPLLAAFLYRRSPSLGVEAAALLAFVGVVFLTYRPGTALVRGDLLTVGAAVAFAGHIIALDRLASRHSLVSFTAVQLLITGVLAFPLAAAIEGIPLPGRRQLPAILITALGVSIGGYLLQLWAQTIISPSRTAILLALEPAFAVATAAVVLSERLTVAGWVGAGLIMVAILLVIRFGAAEVAGKDE